MAQHELSDGDIQRIVKAVWAEHDCKFSCEERAELHAVAETHRDFKKAKAAFVAALLVSLAGGFAWALWEGFRTAVRK